MLSINSASKPTKTTKSKHFHSAHKAKCFYIWINNSDWLRLKYYRLGMATGRVFSGTRPAPLRFAPNGTGFKFNKQFGTGMRFFFKTRGGFGYYPIPPRPAPFTYKIPNGVPSIWFVPFFNYTSAFRATHNQIIEKKN